MTKSCPFGPTPLEVLRRHVMDWGECDRPETCECSHAQALRLLKCPAP